VPGLSGATPDGRFQPPASCWPSHLAAWYEAAGGIGSTRMSLTTHHSDGHARRSLAAADLPRRVRKALDAALRLVSAELDPYLATLLDEYEQELFRLAERARHPGSE